MFHLDEFDDYDDFDDDFDDDFSSFDDDFDDDFSSFDEEYNKEDIDLFDEKPPESDYDINAREVHISTQLTSRKIIELMDNYPSLKRITCPQSIYNRISPKYIDVLSDLGVSIGIKYNWGKKKYSKEEISDVIDLLNEGKNAEEVSNQLDIPLKRVNYFKSKYYYMVNVNNRKKKYDDETRDRLISLKENGLKPKEISLQENIPLRTVYYILNKK